MRGWLHSLFMLLVFALLGGLAWWGHHTGWGLSGHGASEPAPAPGDVEVLPGGRLRFASAEAVDRAGLDFVAAYVSSIEEAVAAPAVVAFDATRHARLSARAGGAVWRVHKQVGDKVEAGEVLALIDAPEAGRARAELAESLLLVAVRTRTLETLRGGAGVVPEPRLREAEATLKEARVKVAAARQALASLDLPVPDEVPSDLTPGQLSRRLRFLGLPAEMAARLEKETATACLVPVVAPIGGEVLAVDVVPGEAVEPGRPLFVVADPSRLWLTVAVKPEDAARVRAGQAVRFLAVSGAVDWVSPATDEATRTVEVRVVLDRDSEVLVGLRGPARVAVRKVDKAVLVPREAALYAGGEAFVLVRDRAYFTAEEKLIHVRPVRLGAADGDQVEVADGLAADEVVVTKGAARLFDAARHKAKAATGRG